MTRLNYVLLFVAGLAVPALISSFQPFPGYLDSDYYFAGGLRLAEGWGFTDSFLWNYLDDPLSLPHASHGYWMPLASILAAASMQLTGRGDYAGARVLFLVVAGLVPALTAAVAYSFTARRDLAITSALLATFSAFYAPFLPVTDNFGLFMVLGASFFLFAGQPRSAFWLGLVAGAMSLARTDGVLWMLLVIVVVLARASSGEGKGALWSICVASVGFLAIMLPWYLRNLDTWGAIVAPGGARLLWLREYDEIFSYPASDLTPARMLADGWVPVLRDRWWALGQNIQSAVAAQGAIVLSPLAVVGAIAWRRDLRVRTGVLGWALLFVGMTLAIPFAGARGGFFHASAAFQPLWWSLAPIGLDAAVDWARHRGWFTASANVLFRVVLVQVLLLLTAYAVWFRVFSLGWGEGEHLYPRVRDFLTGHQMKTTDVVVTRNPAGWYITTGLSAVAIPYGGIDAVTAVSERYGARFLVLEELAAIGTLRPLYAGTATDRAFEYLGDVDGARLYEILRR